MGTGINPPQVPSLDSVYLNLYSLSLWLNMVELVVFQAMTKLISASNSTAKESATEVHSRDLVAVIEIVSSEKPFKVHS